VKRILAGLALALLIASPVSAATASLSVVSIVPVDTSSGLGTVDGSITFASDPYKGQPNRVLIWQCYASWWTFGPSESDTPTIDKQTGLAKIYFRNGIHEPSGTLYCQNWTAWVALRDTWQTPISPVVSGAF